MTVDRAACGSGDDVIRDGNGKRGHEETHGIVNPEAAEGCAPRTGNEFRYKITDRVGEHREDNAANNVPAADVEIREAGLNERQDKLENHQDEGEDDESVYDERKFGPLQRLAETGENQHPSGKDYRKIPDTEENPSKLAA